VPPDHFSLIRAQARDPYSQQKYGPKPCLRRERFQCMIAREKEHGGVTNITIIGKHSPNNA
jgi:hypothetical protein